MTKKGFTLIELLAVVIILAVVVIIGTPLILNVIEDAYRSTNKSQVELLLAGANRLYAQSYLDEDSKNLLTDVNIYNNIPVSGELPENGILKIKPSGEVFLNVFIDGICYSKDYEEDTITVNELSTEDECVSLTATITPKEEVKEWYGSDLVITINTNGDGFKYQLNDNELVTVYNKYLELTLTETTTVKVIPIKDDVIGEDVIITYKIDKEIPTISANTLNTINIEEGTKEDLTKYFDTNHNGLSNINYSCSDTSLLKIGEHNVSCTITSEAGHSASASINVNIKPRCDDSLVSVKLTDGLIPVSIANNGVVTKAGENFYNYCNQEWANAILINDDTIRENYQDANPGTIIELDAISAYYVYIPRYEYQIFDTDTNISDIGDLSSIDENDGIQIRFVDTNSSNKMVESPVIGEYYTHPSFTFGDEEIAGFWIGKFELTGSTTEPTILPNTNSIRGLNVSTFYKTVQKINYGLSTDLTVVDSHMLKNMEWGAVAYLSYSEYGINDEVWINNNSDYITGCGAVANNSAITELCQNKYGESTIYNQSTTGNISGVFDMSGGSYEYVMGNMQDASGNFYSSISGFGNTVIDGKYYDSYPYGTTYNDSLAYERGLYGDATFEVTAWNEDYSQFLNSSFSWVLRGGYSTSSSGAGLFSFGRHYGYGLNYVGTRASLIVY